jgi:CheY-like chemotaxis protein
VSYVLKQAVRASSPSILIVEDDVSFRQLLCDLLTFADYRVMTASSGVETLQMLHSADWVPDLILADVIMSGMNGCELLERVRTEKTDWNAVPFILISTSREFHAACPHLEIEPEGYIAKPFSFEQLVAVIQSVLQSSHT